MTAYVAAAALVALPRSGIWPRPPRPLQAQCPLPVVMERTLPPRPWWPVEAPPRVCARRLPAAERIRAFYDQADQPVRDMLAVAGWASAWS